jgi:hypothetical protein
MPWTPRHVEPRATARILGITTHARGPARRRTCGHRQEPRHAGRRPVSAAFVRCGGLTGHRPVRARHDACLTAMRQLPLGPSIPCDISDFGTLGGRVPSPRVRSLPSRWGLRESATHRDRSVGRDVGRAVPAGAARGGALHRRGRDAVLGTAAFAGADDGRARRGRSLEGRRRGCRGDNDGAASSSPWIRHWRLELRWIAPCAFEPGGLGG